eukprot:gnl/TRDRNA2_/TRDRNA2_201771_c0_seq1.p1 gnl/TRDRNA2_/TRDRNA2_201771_c0~~gnl/TRDRNA2_/TRDRNA2_201771_c0_seq1.p1  ORF type:complete len:493 (+),score=64.50 gnl/TRDRNA2_/TRDRNA2_201771_c0_seq1:99-1577(+)
MMLWILTVFLACVGAFIWHLMQRMPSPYQEFTAMEIEPERLRLVPGFEQGSTFPANLTGPFAINQRLKAAKRLFEGRIPGSESIAVAPDGQMFMLDKFGYVHRADRSTGEYVLSEAPPFYIGPGRPLGAQVVEGGAGLVVCDSLKGLLHVDLKTGSFRTLANQVTETGKPFHYANDLDVAPDGTVYFSSSTAGIVERNEEGFYDTMRSYLLHLMRGDASGQLLAWDPSTSTVRVLVSGLAYANGVALSEDGSFVTVVETSLCRVHRHWLTGPKKGSTDIFIDKLPGFPDGISRGADGGFWVALVAPLNPLQPLTAPHRWLRQLFSHALVLIYPFIAKRWGCVVRLSPDGTPLETLMDPDGGHVSTVSAVTEHKGELFIGNVGGDSVSVLDLSTGESPSLRAAATGISSSALGRRPLPLSLHRPGRWGLVSTRPLAPVRPGGRALLGHRLVQSSTELVGIPLGAVIGLVVSLVAVYHCGGDMRASARQPLLAP